jgi:inositol-hexakisphosphate 5-kinase
VTLSGQRHQIPSSDSASDYSTIFPPTARKARPRPSIPASYLTNVLSMSNPLDSPPKSILTTVKCLNAHHDSAPSLSSSQTRTKPTSSGVTSAFNEKPESPTNTVENVRKARFGESSPVLSERESIFATNYLPSDGNFQTPRLPAAEGADDVADLPQNLTTMEVALPSPLPQSPISYKRLLSPRQSRTSHIANNVAQKKLPDTSTTISKQLDESRGTIHTVRRMASEGQPGKQILQLRVTDQPRPLEAENFGAVLVGEEMSKGKNDAREDPSPILESSQARRERESAMRETLGQTGGKERSSSRGRSRVEKSIEATLPNREPGKNVRTRKASHLMGIFKETASSEIRKRETHSKLATARYDEESGRRLSLTDSGVSQLRSQSILSTPSTSFVEEPLPLSVNTGGSARPSSAHFGDLSIQTGHDDLVALPDTANSCPSTPLSPSNTQRNSEHDPYFRKRDQIKRSMSGTRPVIPAKLLEEIRKQHNLSPIGGNSTTFYQSLPSLVDVIEPPKPKSIQGVPPENAEHQDNEDEDEEHISSAVYFPHPGPSDEDIEQFTSPDEDQKQEPLTPLLASASPTPKAELKRTLSDTVLPEHIDISVKSKHEKRVFHGDYRRSEELLGDEGDVQRKPARPVSEIVIDSPSSASESELSSCDEFGDLSQAEGGEVTPTSTPTPQNLLQRRKRRIKTLAPKGAVVLEPYSHQVGGHSTLFRFSRRAICKKLNNRENEFYERIEQRHPDMLQFLPRLVTVIFFFCSNYAFSALPK